MKHPNFTAERIAGFQCEPGKHQSIFWDGKAPGLGLRVTASGAKSYIFETRLHGKTLRLTIGDVRTWTIAKAQAEATRYKALTDQGINPRKASADEEDKRATAAAEAKAEAARNSVTLNDVWSEYVAERSPRWSEHHIAAHKKMIQPGGAERKRSPKRTKAGPLAALAGCRLCELTPVRIEKWASDEAATRPSSGRLALRLLKACLNWCESHPVYSGILAANPTRSAKAREVLGKPKAKDEVLQREQLAAWFCAVRQIHNPIISAYLQTLLLTGARREEVAALRWGDIDFRWKSIRMKDKVNGQRVVPLTPYVESLLLVLPQVNEWVFSSPKAETGRLAEPRIAHNQALAIAGLPSLDLQGLRRSFASLSEWIEMPAGIAAQIQGHAPQGVREQNYVRRPLDLLRKWHVHIEAWILDQAGLTHEVLAVKRHDHEK